MGCIFSRRQQEKPSFDIDNDSLYEVPNWKIEAYLINHPEFIQNYIRDHLKDFANLHQLLNRQKTLNDFMLDLVKSIFHDMVSIDVVIKKVMAYAPRLVDADRASLFLMDNNTSELYARIYNADQSVTELNDNSDKWKEIRFKIGTGIAGKVAETGQPLNIPDAYADPRFNRAVDQETGYLTKSILCMPIFIHGAIMGVVQMVNKKSTLGIFDEDDVRAFEHFALYCGLALHHAKLYDKVRKAEEKFKVALEMLAYHTFCTDEEFIYYSTTQVIHGPPTDLTEFSFVTTRMDDIQRVHLTVYMFIDLFGLGRFDRNVLYRFVITVKKNYRRVPYHNWVHAFTVAHCMYCILKGKKHKFKYLESLSLFVSSLCHDLDHRGKNNQFLVETSSPLSTIYRTSQLEHHHFNQAVSIIQQEGLNLFANLNSKEYKEILVNMKHCIIATDLKNHFDAKMKLNIILNKKMFSWDDPEHRLLAQGIVMTSSDLSACAKPWDIHVETVSTIVQEFWEQGDMEKKQGRTPIPMMDRDMSTNVPISQINFLSNICVGCYEILCQLIPETESLLNGTLENLDQWKIIAELDQKKSNEGRKN